MVPSAARCALRHTPADPAERTAQPSAPMPPEVKHESTNSAQTVTYEDKRTGPISILDRPCLLCSPTGTRAAYPHFGMVAEVHDAVWVVHIPAAPTLTRQRVSGCLIRGERGVHGQPLAARSLRASRRAWRSGTFRGPSAVRYIRQASAPPSLPLWNRSTPSTTNAGEPASRRALAASSLSMILTVNGVPAKPMSSRARRSSADAASLPGHPGMTSTSTSIPAS